MAITPNVSAGNPITIAWGNEIRDRSVQNFATAAERSSQWAAPPEGAVSYLRDVDQLQFYNGTIWLPFTTIPHSSMAQSNSALFGAPSSTSSTAYASVPTAPCNIASFTKYRADTKLIFELHCTTSPSMDLGRILWGVRFNSVDRDMSPSDYTYNVTALRVPASFMLELTGIAAGVYTNTEARLKVVSPNVASFYTNGDYVFLKVTETL